jgi:ABC-type sugar transport system substrate-binding protein
MDTKKLNILVSLTVNDGNYQTAEAKASQETARRLGVNVEVIFAENDAINQSQQLLKAIQSPPGSRPSVIMFEPVGTGMTNVAKAAVAAGMGWVVLNRDVDDLTELRRNCKLPVFSVSSDHVEIGRIQGLQLNKILPNGGSVLCVQGPATSAAAQKRTSGMKETMNKNLNVRYMFGHWTEDSAHATVSSWLRLPTSREAPMHVVIAQNDLMAMGARNACLEIHTADKAKWSAMRFLGVDGLADHGQAWVHSGMLVATVVNPTNSNVAIEMLVKAVQTGALPQERTMTQPTSFPPLGQLRPAI